jgi:hypothetical protein
MMSVGAGKASSCSDLQMYDVHLGRFQESLSTILASCQPLLAEEDSFQFAEDAW